MSDDVWGSDSDGGHAELEREARVRQDTFENYGFREGAAEGRDRALQGGFNLGFGEGTALGQEWGIIRGLLRCEPSFHHARVVFACQ